MNEGLFDAFDAEGRAREEAAPQRTGQGADTRLLDALRSAELYLRQDAEPGEEDKHFVTCPWADYHSSGTKPLDSFVRDGSGSLPPLFHCSHAHSGHPDGPRKYALSDLVAWLTDAGHLVEVETKEAARPVFHLSDDGNAERLIYHQGENIRYCHGLGWSVWNGFSWQFGDASESDVVTLITETVRAIREEEIDDSELQEKTIKHAAKSEGAERINAVLKLARHKPAIRAVPEQFDDRANLISFRNGTVDLITSTLREHRREDYLSRSLRFPYNPEARCPRFQRFLSEIFCGNDELVAFMKRALGYSLTGDVRAQCFFFCHGDGSNGKGTLLGLFQELLGGYATPAAAGLLLESRNERHTTDIVDLRGRRMVISSEVGESKALAEDLVKRLTGGDKLKGRLMHQNNVEFKPTFKLWLMANPKPIVRGTDYAIWRRILLVPFEAQFVDREERDKRLRSAREGGTEDPTRVFLKDETLHQNLIAEAPGILAWAVEGAAEWYRTGLEPPEAVRAASEAYRVDSDVVGRFLEECCTVKTGLEVRAVELLATYTCWARENGEPGYKANRLGREITKRGIERRNDKGTIYRGLALNPAGNAYRARHQLLWRPEESFEEGEG